jgi:hypothetical protein
MADPDYFNYQGFSVCMLTILCETALLRFP